MRNGNESCEWEIQVNICKLCVNERATYEIWKRILRLMGQTERSTQRCEWQVQLRHTCVIRNYQLQKASANERSTCERWSWEMQLGLNERPASGRLKWEVQRRGAHEPDCQWWNWQVQMRGRHATCEWDLQVRCASDRCRGGGGANEMRKSLERCKHTSLEWVWFA